MSETPPVHIGTDRVELTEDEREALAEAVNRGSLGPAVESIVAARVQALTAERDFERSRCASLAKTADAYMAERDAARAELARWVEDWGSFTPGECETGIHPDFAFDHEDSVTCPICAADKWKSEHDLSASITHQLQIETERLQAELAAANTRCAELEAELVAEKEQLRHEVAGLRDERDALQETLDRVTDVLDEYCTAGCCQHAESNEKQLHDLLRAALTPEGTE